MSGELAEAVAEGLRSGTIRLCLDDPKHDTPEVQAWLRDCERYLAEEYERQLGFGHA